MLMFFLANKTRTTTSQGNMSKQKTTLYFFIEVEILSHLNFVWIYSIKAQDIYEYIQ